MHVQSYSYHGISVYKKRIIYELENDDTDESGKDGKKRMGINVIAKKTRWKLYIHKNKHGNNFHNSTVHRNAA